VRVYERTADSTRARSCGRRNTTGSGSKDNIRSVIRGGTVETKNKRVTVG